MHTLFESISNTFDTGRAVVATAEAACEDIDAVSA